MLNFRVEDLDRILSTYTSSTTNLFPHFRTDKFPNLSNIIFPVSIISFSVLFNEFNKYKNLFPIMNEINKYTSIKNQEKILKMVKIPPFPVFFWGGGLNSPIFPVFWVKFPDFSGLSKIPDFSLTGKCFSIFSGSQSTWEPCFRRDLFYLFDSLHQVKYFRSYIAKN